MTIEVKNTHPFKVSVQKWNPEADAGAGAWEEDENFRQRLLAAGEGYTHGLYPGYKVSFWADPIPPE